MGDNVAPIGVVPVSVGEHGRGNPIVEFLIGFSLVYITVNIVLIFRLGCCQTG